MDNNDKKRFSLDYSFYDSDFDTYFNKDKKFGRFIEDGKAYVIEDMNTPRQWFQYLCNDKIRSGVTNDGKGFIWHYTYGYATKQWDKTYLVRTANGKRTFKIIFGDNTFDFFDDAQGLTETVRPGYVVFKGDILNLEIEFTIFVPKNIPCECWKINIKNNSNKASEFKIDVSMDWIKKATENADFPNVQIYDNKTIELNNENISFVLSSNFSGECNFDNNREATYFGVPQLVTTTSFLLDCSLKPQEECVRNFVLGVHSTNDEKTEINNCLESDCMNLELEKVKEEWQRIFSINNCSLPNKNLEYFLNYWLKNQLYLTYRYNRGEGFDGYRDVLQDSWGYCLVDPQNAKRKILKALSFMYPDGRCPRQYNEYNGQLDKRDYSDSPIWAANTLSSYIKETGDYEILSEQIGFYGSDEKSAVEEHIFRALNYLYHSRGENGLILIRDGDWADGLGGINKYGDKATSVWLTIAAFYAQNVMREIYEHIGCTDKAEILTKRCEEYKKIVNSVGWDGNWYVYGFFEDGEPIGSSKNSEGKIWLNPQTWAIFSGIVDSEDKIRRITRAVNRYLLTPFGSMVCYPPYVFYGERCGRISKQIPGTFLNSSIYNHAASFKIFSDIARGDYEDAFDSLMMALPNHPDNSDCCRTSEPYAVGNVYYGVNNERYGMNLFTWFTATAAWLIHGGYEEILGVKADFDGIIIEPHIPSDWQEYRVSKLYRKTRYLIHVIKSADKLGIWVDGEKIKGNLVCSNKEICNVEVYIKG